MSKSNLPVLPEHDDEINGQRLYDAASMLRYAEEAVRQALAEQAASLRAFADRKYCAAIEYARRNEALGWESKAKGGRFGTDEYACHQKMNEAFGAHFSIYEALKQVVLIPENSNGEST